MLCVCTFSFGLSRKKKIPKRKGTGYVYGATPILPCADGAQTRYAQTEFPILPTQPEHIQVQRRTIADVSGYYIYPSVFAFI